MKRDDFLMFFPVPLLARERRLGVLLFSAATTLPAFTWLAAIPERLG
jgi:hypothetical protein